MIQYWCLRHVLLLLLLTLRTSNSTKLSQTATLLTADNEPSVLKFHKCDHTFTVDFNAISIEGGTSNHLETTQNILEIPLKCDNNHPGNHT